MPATKIDLFRQAVGRVFTFGSNTAGNQALVTIQNGTQPTTNLVLDVKGSQNISGDLTVNGNFTFAGSIDRLSVSNIDVNDKIIRVNNGGTTAGAAGSGIEVEGTGDTLIGAIRFDSTKNSKFTAGDGATQRELVASNNAATAGTVLTGNADGTSSYQAAPAGTSTYSRSTIVSGTQDGSNTAFTIGNTLLSGSEQVFVNGILMNPGATNDYTISATTVTFIAGGSNIPLAGDAVRVYGVY